MKEDHIDELLAKYPPNDTENHVFDRIIMNHQNFHKSDDLENVLDEKLEVICRQMVDFQKNAKILIRAQLKVLRENYIIRQFAKEINEVN